MVGLLSVIYNKNTKFFRQFLPPIIPIHSYSFSFMGSFMTAIDKDKNNANEATKGNHR